MNTEQIITYKENDDYWEENKDDLDDIPTYNPKEEDNRDEFDGFHREGTPQNNIRVKHPDEDTFSPDPS